MINSTTLYGAENMSGINLWVGRDYTFRRGTIGLGGDNFGDTPLPGPWADLYRDFPFEFRPRYEGEAVGVFDASFAANGYVAPTLRFDNFADIPVRLGSDSVWNALLDDEIFVTDWLHRANRAAVTPADRADFIGKVEALWVLRVGNQVDQYVTYRAKRSQGLGTGGGRLGPAFINGAFVVPEIRFELFDTHVMVNAMTIQRASSAAAITALGPILNFANLEGDMRNLDGMNRPGAVPGDPGTPGLEWRGQWNAPNSELTSIGNRADTGPVLAEWQRNGTQVNNATANVPVQSNIREHYLAGPRDNAMTGAGIRGVNRCEFGMPAPNKSHHVMNLQTISGRIVRNGVAIDWVTLLPNSQGNLTYTASFALFGYDPAAPVVDGSIGGPFAYVSGREALGLGDGMPAEYIRFLRCEVQMEVWPSGLIGRWFYDAPWDASLFGVMVASVDMYFEEIFMCDALFIIGDNGMITLLDRMRAIA